MKKLIATTLLMTALPLSAVTLQFQSGTHTLIDGTTAVPDGTFWALVVDNGDNLMPGGLAPNTSLTAANEASILGAFVGTSLGVGTTIGSDTVFAVGGFDSTVSGQLGVLFAVRSFALGSNGTAGNRNYGFYFFPGITYSNAPLTALDGVYQIGGIHSSINDVDAGVEGMVLPASDAATVTQGAAEASVGGTIPASRFAAAVAVPEPSTAALGLLAGLGLMVRRRRD